MRLRDSSRRNENGMALVMVLLLLALVTVLGLGMVVAASSDMLINGYYRNARGAFYAADSGVHIARQQLINQTLAGVPAEMIPGTPPLPGGTASAARASVLAAYGSYFTLRPGAEGGEWSGRFRITAVDFDPVMVPDPNNPGGQLAYTVTSWDNDYTPPIPNGFQYLFNYRIVSEGSTTMRGLNVVEEAGTLVFNAALTPASPMKISFAAWGMFIDQYEVCSGGYLVPGTITGPVFTNGGWTFGTTGAYTFTDPVGSVSPTFGYQFSASGCGCRVSPSTSQNCRSQSISPNYQAGVMPGQNPVPLPENDFSQKRAVLDGIGDASAGPVTNAEMNSKLKRANGTAYPAGGATSGVYMAYETVDGVPTMTGGGIYVEGNASVVLSAVGDNVQQFTITQGGTTSTISIDLANLTTTFTTGGNTQVLAGVPSNYLVSPPSPATMLYVNGSITSLKGPAQGVAAIQDAAAVTVTALNDVTITGDVIYKAPPVTTAQNQIPGAPPGTLIPENNTGQVLGIFTANGDIRLSNQQSNGTLAIHASLATISQGGTGGLVNVGNRINTLTILGGRIQNNIKNINSTTRNVFFDRRFAQAGFAPPWFPATTFTPAGVATAVVTPTVQRTRWANLTNY